MREQCTQDAAAYAGALIPARDLHLRLVSTLDACQCSPMKRIVALIGSIALALTITTPPAVAADAPDPEMLAVVERVARFIETLDAAEIADVFADRDVTIIENFAPYRFDGATALDAWASGMRAHREATTDLHHAFGAPQDYSRSGDQAFFSLPTTWTGRFRATPFTETGGWAFVLKRQNDRWRIQSYGWAVTSITTP